MMFVLQILFKALVWRVGIEFMSASTSAKRERAGFFTLVGLHLTFVGLLKAATLLTLVFPFAVPVLAAAYAGLWFWSLASYFGIGWRGALWMIPTQAICVLVFTLVARLLPGL
jgi:hypothetical protein